MYKELISTPFKLLARDLIDAIAEEDWRTWAYRI